MTELTGKYFKAYDSDKTPLWVIFIADAGEVSYDQLINGFLESDYLIQEIDKQEYDDFEHKATVGKGGKITTEQKEL